MRGAGDQPLPTLEPPVLPGLVADGRNRGTRHSNASTGAPSSAARRPSKASAGRRGGGGERGALRLRRATRPLRPDVFPCACGTPRVGPAAHCGAQRARQMLAPAPARADAAAAACDGTDAIRCGPCPGCRKFPGRLSQLPCRPGLWAAASCLAARVASSWKFQGSLGVSERRAPSDARNTPRPVDSFFLARHQVGRGGFFSPSCFCVSWPFVGELRRRLAVQGRRCSPGRQRPRRPVRVVAVVAPPSPLNYRRRHRQLWCGTAALRRMYLARRGCHRNPR